jgi:predicted NUDIX family phosphoesterase
LPGEWLGERTVLKMDEHLFFKTCSSAGFEWIERSAAESDPAFKQIIPYIAIHTRGSTSRARISRARISRVAASRTGVPRTGSSLTATPSLMAIYKRKGSEKRLHDLYSMGIGGHINSMDEFQQSNGQEISFKELVMAGMMRELHEELIQRPLEDRPVFRGIINEEITDVGKVHLGALFVIVTDSPQAFVPGDELFEFQWLEREHIAELNLELWSTMALQII